MVTLRCGVITWKEGGAIFRVDLISHHGPGKIFSRRRARVDFSRGSQKYFWEGEPKMLIFHFSFSKVRKQPFLLKMQWENVKFQNLRWAKTPLTPPLPTPMSRASVTFFGAASIIDGVG